jgi:hypothetical protein
LFSRFVCVVGLFGITHHGNWGSSRSLWWNRSVCV